MLGCGRLTDPWLISKVFNNSWTLMPAPDFEQSLLHDVGFIWLSHEHPDHLNFPTLASLPLDFRSRVTILFQRNNPERIFEPLRKIGYRNFLVLPHRRIVRITDKTSVYCFRVGTIDSCLGVINEGQVVFNANDARMNRDCKIVLREVGPADALNHLSPHTHADHQTYKRAACNLLTACPPTTVIARLSDDTVRQPMYFSTTDNRFMNATRTAPAMSPNSVQPEDSTPTHVSWRRIRGRPDHDSSAASEIRPSVFHHGRVLRCSPAVSLPALQECLRFDGTNARKISRTTA